MGKSASGKDAVYRNLMGDASLNLRKNIMYTIANSGFYTTTAYAKAKMAEEEAAEAVAKGFE